MILNNTKEREILYFFKDIISEELFQLIINSKSNINQMKEEEVLKLMKELNKNLEKLSIILTKIEKDFDLSTNLDTGNFNTEYLIARQVKFNFTNKGNSNKIEFPDYNFKDKTNLLNFFKLVSYLHRLYYNCVNRKDILQIYDSKFGQRALTMLEKKHDEKQQNKKILRQRGSKTVILNQNYDNRVSSFGLPKTIFKNFKEIAILAAFSEFKNFYSKSLQQSNYAQVELGTELNLLQTEEFQNKMSKDFKNNQRKFLSGIASTVYIHKLDCINNLFNLIFNENSKANEKNYTDLNQFNIQNLIYVYKEDDYLNFEDCPRFMHINENETTFKFTIISLDLFSLVLSTLLYSSKSIKKTKLNKNNEIIINNDLKTNFESLYWNILNFFNLKRSVFIFNNCSWSDVLKSLFKYGLEVSGGSVVKRHVLNPTDFKLAQFLSKFSDNGHKDVVISTNLLDKSIYQSKFDKSDDFTFDPNLLGEKINKFADSILDDLIENLSLNFDIDNLESDNEFKLNIKNFILNKLIFLNLSPSRGKSFFNADLTDKNSTLFYIEMRDYLEQITSTNQKANQFENKNFKYNYLINKLNSQKRSYSTTTKFNSNKINTINNFEETKKIKTVLTPKSVKSNIRVLLRNKNFKSDFVKFEIKLALSTHLINSAISLGEFSVLNLNNKFEKNFYVEYLLNNFLNFNIDSKEQKGILMLQYSETNIDNYKIYIDTHLKIQETEKESDFKEVLYNTWNYLETNLQTSFDSKKTRLYLNKNIKKFTSLYRYLLIRTEIYNENKTSDFIGQKKILNLNNKKEIKTYIDSVIQTAGKNFISSNCCIKVSLRKSNSAEYRAYLLYKNLNNNILPIHDVSNIDLSSFQELDLDKIEFLNDYDAKSTDKDFGIMDASDADQYEYFFYNNY